MRCVCCNSNFHPRIIYKKDAEGKTTDEFERFEDMCYPCISSTWNESSYEELFSEQWVKPVPMRKHTE